jgi:hypothetical protein
MQIAVTRSDSIACVETAGSTGLLAWEAMDGHQCCPVTCMTCRCHTGREIERRTSGWNMLEDTMNEQAPLPYGVAARGLIRCAMSTAGMLMHHRIHFHESTWGCACGLRIADAAHHHRGGAAVPSRPQALLLRSHAGGAWQVGGGAVDPV